MTMQSVLVVDDAPIDRRLAGGWLEANGFQPVYAENGREALECISSEKPDFVLTDLQMPEMDGLELVRQMRQRHPTIPVILMTGNGSEEIAVEALKSGAASYVPKQTLKVSLGNALEIVRSAAEAIQNRETVRELLEFSESRFVLGYDPAVPRALISHLQDGLVQLNFCDQSALLQISTALGEGIANAIDHGNLELDSTLREDGSYRKVGMERAQRQPFRDRRVYVTARLTPTEASYVIRDEGKGFDPGSLPDPTDPENMLKPSGRGVMLMRTFMHDVRFNSTGNELTMIKRRSS